MKKNVLFMLFGMIIATVTIVIADNLNASEIDYRDTKVDQALDTLYQRTTATEYDGSIEVTPSTTQQTLSTTNKLLKSDITINAIPSTFKELTQNTTVAANKLLSGVTAYDNNGNLITGSLSVSSSDGAAFVSSGWKKGASWNNSGFTDVHYIDTEYVTWDNQVITINKDCTLYITSTIKNTDAPSAAPKYTLYKNSTAILSLTGDKTASSLNRNALTVSLKAGDTLYASMYGGGGNPSIFVTAATIVNN